LDKFIITGGKKLEGKTQVSGAKNASLALIPATLLSYGKSTLFNTPELNDVFTMIKLIKHLGVESTFSNSVLELNTTNINNYVAPYEHVKKMRASVYVLGPLLTRFGYAKVSLPGGCAWGPRPINLHLEGKKLNGAKIIFDVSSVGATGNLLMAAVLAKGTTVISNAALEPEIINLAEFLVKMGAKIEGINTTTLTIEGVDSLQAANAETISDRIEAGTILIAAAITKGKVVIEKIDPKYLNAVILKLEDSGCKVKLYDHAIEVDAQEIMINPTNISTAPFPGFPTDVQAQWTAYMSLANGVSTVTDTVYLDRFMHVSELVRLGADIVVKENSAVIKGVSKLKGAKVMSTDLRASACLVLAGLAAEGNTEVLRVYHLDRGYQRIEEKLMSLGASIERVEGKEY